MEIYTGAGHTIISDQDWRLFGKPALMASQLRLRTHTDESVDVKGTFEAQFDIGENQHCLPVLIGVREGPALLGRNWLNRVRLDWSRIFKLSAIAVADMLAPFEELFKPELGTIQAPLVHLQLKPHAVPKFHRSRQIPYALRDQVKDELRHLDNKVREKIDHSDWAAPIVVVKKANGSLRICGDYKVTINEALVVNQYPFPFPEDIFATFEGSVLFSGEVLSRRHPDCWSNCRRTLGPGEATRGNAGLRCGGRPGDWPEPSSRGIDGPNHDWHAVSGNGDRRTTWNNRGRGVVHGGNLAVDKPDTVCPSEEGTAHIQSYQRLP